MGRLSEALGVVGLCHKLQELDKHLKFAFRGGTGGQGMRLRVDKQWRRRLWDRLLARWKWGLSFRKQSWVFSDYPVRVRRQTPGLERSTPSPDQPRYRAYIVNWLITGVGNTPAEAKADLKERFGWMQKDGTGESRSKIRPGTRQPLKLASQNEIAAYHEINEEFVQRIFGLEAAWVSDESSLWDFHFEPDNEEMYRKIRELYGVDVSDIASANLIAIFRRITESRTSDGHHD